MKNLIIFITTLTLGYQASAGQDSADLARDIFRQRINDPQSNEGGTGGQMPPPGGTPFPNRLPPPPLPPPRAPTIPPGAQMPPGGGQSINPAANQGQQSQNGGSGANNAAGAALIAAGAALMANPPTQPMGAMLIAMGMMALAQGSHDSNAAGQSGRTAGASAYQGAGSNGTTGGSTDPKNPDFGSGKGGFSNDIKTGEAALGQAGYTMTKDGLVGPDGKLTPTSAFSSPGAMAKAGIDPSMIKEAGKVTGALNEEIAKLQNVSGVPTADGGGGGGSMAGGDGSGSGSNRGGNPFGLNDGARKALVAGKTVNFDGEPIGVRGQNIFDMIHTCYQKKRARNDFLEVEDRTQVRAPANVPRRPPTR